MSNLGVLPIVELSEPLASVRVYVAEHFRAGHGATCSGCNQLARRMLELLPLFLAEIQAGRECARFYGANDEHDAARAAVDAAIGERVPCHSV